MQLFSILVFKPNLSLLRDQGGFGEARHRFVPRKTHRLLSAHNSFSFVSRFIDENYTLSLHSAFK